MLFNSNLFIFVFLPVTLAVFYLLTRVSGGRYALGWLTLASLFFYGFWDPGCLLIIVVSILLNYYVFGKLLTQGVTDAWRKKIILAVGIGANLLAIGYYKYTNFVVDNLNAYLDFSINIEYIALPLAISFFTFQQIAYLCDVYEGHMERRGLTDYALFVSFFPQLIAGPIVHHAEVMPQFRDRKWLNFSPEDFAVGVTIFVFGLFKKVVLADAMSAHVGPVFALAETGQQMSFVTAWAGALAYSFQLYFDFSGYSDMAIGLGRMFGIHIPLNFNSPYKANNIIEFWRRWHITLSRFLRDYLYIRLGGNQKGRVRRYVNLMVTMFLGGIWHGAGWTFVIWGTLHGFYLVINHLWRGMLRIIGFDAGKPSLWGVIGGRLLTFVAVVVAWVIFRAETMDGAWHLISSMFALNGLVLPVEFMQFVVPGLEVEFIKERVLDDELWLWLLVLFLIVMFAPNTQQIMMRYKPGYDVDKHIVPYRFSFVEWRPGIVSAVIIFLMFCVAQYRMDGPSEFLYFDF